MWWWVRLLMKHFPANYSPNHFVDSVAPSLGYCDTLAAVPHIARYLSRKVSSPPKWCDTPPWHLVSHGNICAIPHFATYRAIPLQPIFLQKRCCKRIVLAQLILFYKMQKLKQSLYKANSFVCSLANRDKPVAATLQRKCSGGIIL